MTSIKSSLLCLVCFRGRRARAVEPQERVVDPRRWLAACRKMRCRAAGRRNIGWLNGPMNRED
jgi:hypothetical protein